MARAWNKLSANFVRGVEQARPLQRRRRFVFAGRARRHQGVGFHIRAQRRAARRWASARCARCHWRWRVSWPRKPESKWRAASIRSTPARPPRCEQRAARARLMTFRECAEEYHAANLTRWTNDKHRREWISALQALRLPGDRPPVGRHDRQRPGAQGAAAARATKAVTAARLRGRIETVLDYAKAAGRRTGDNPADKAIIAHMLPMKSEKADVNTSPPAVRQAARAHAGSCAPRPATRRGCLS